VDQRFFKHGRFVLNYKERVSFDLLKTHAAFTKFMRSTPILHETPSLEASRLAMLRESSIRKNPILMDAMNDGC
jgi:hypothetical protein